MIYIFFLSHILYTIHIIPLLYLSCSKLTSSVVKKKTNTQIKSFEFPEVSHNYWSRSLSIISIVKQSLALLFSGTAEYTLTGTWILNWKYLCYHTDLAHFLLQFLYFHDMSHFGLAHWKKDKFTATLHWFTLAWGSVVQSRFSQKCFVLTWIRSEHSLSFLFFSVYHTFKLNGIYTCLEAKWFFYIDTWNVQQYLCFYFGYEFPQLLRRWKVLTQESMSQNAIKT